MGFRATPAQNTGYNRMSDWPVAGGAGFRVDGLAAGIGGGVSLKNSTISAPGSTGNWHPSVVWMLGFVAFELVAFHALSRFLNL